MIQLILTPDDSGTKRGTGYATVPYSSDSEDETVVETTEDKLSAIFENANSSGETVDGADESMDAAIEDPLAFRDYLILDSDGEITFDSGHTRENK
mgnify:CR=1 FL=1